MVDTISPDNYIKILDSDANQRSDKGVALIQTAVLAGQQYNLSILGAYAQVKAQYDLTGTAIVAGSIVLGDNTGERFKLLPAGDPAVEPENDTNINPVTGVGDNWVNLEIAFANTFVSGTLNRDYFLESGVDDNFILSSASPNIVVTEYLDGAGIVFLSDRVNTGGSSVNIDGVGIKPILDFSENPLVGGEISPSRYNLLRYRESADAFIWIDNLPAAGSTDVYRILKLNFTAQDIKNPVTTVNDTITISEGFCRNNTFQEPMVLDTALTKFSQSIWSEGNGGGMRPVDADWDATDDAKKLVHVFIISKLDGTTDIGVDSVYDAFNLLKANAAGADGYVFYRRLLSLNAVFSIVNPNPIIGYWPVVQQDDMFTQLSQQYNFGLQNIDGANLVDQIVPFYAMAPKNCRVTGFLNPGNLQNDVASFCRFGVVQNDMDPLRQADPIGRTLFVTPLAGGEVSFENKVSQYTECVTDDNSMLAVHFFLGGGGSAVNGDGLWAIASWQDQRGQDGIIL